MDLKSATLFAGVACMLNTAGLAVNYGSLFVMNRGFHPTPTFFIIMFTSILSFVALSIFFFTFYGKQ
jgi:hypothetical protein